MDPAIQNINLYGFYRPVWSGVYITKLSVIMKDEQIHELVLLRGINSRNEFMVNAFYKQVYQKLSEVAHRYLDDEHDACDVVTDVFMAFLAAEEKYETLSHIEGLLCVRVRWASLDKLKAIKRDNMHRGATELDEVSVTGNSIEDDIVRVEHDYAIKEIIETLPHRYRLVLEQLFFEGKQSPEIASILNANDNVVYIIKNRALKRLKAILADKKLIFILLLFFPPD